MTHRAPMMTRGDAVHVLAAVSVARHGAEPAPANTAVDQPGEVVPRECVTGVHLPRGEGRVALQEVASNLAATALRRIPHPLIDDAQIRPRPGDHILL